MQLVTRPSHDIDGKTCLALLISHLPGVYLLGMTTLRGTRYPFIFAMALGYLILDVMLHVKLFKYLPSPRIFSVPLIIGFVIATCSVFARADYAKPMTAQMALVLVILVYIVTKDTLRRVVSGSESVSGGEKWKTDHVHWDEHICAWGMFFALTMANAS